MIIDGSPNVLVWTKTWRLEPRRIMWAGKYEQPRGLEWGTCEQNCGKCCNNSLGPAYRQPWILYINDLDIIWWMLARYGKSLNSREYGWALTLRIVIPQLWKGETLERWCKSGLAICGCFFDFCFCRWWLEILYFSFTCKNWGTRISLVIQWIRIHLLMQGTQVWSLVQEAAKPLHHNYQAHSLLQATANEPEHPTEPMSCSYWSLCT